MLDGVRAWRNSRYINGLVKRGLRLGARVYLNDGFFLDPSHCFLITIEDDVVFGPGVRLFAHDASSKKVIGKTRIGLVRICRNSFLGAGTTVLPGVTVGANSIIGANSTVTTDVPPDEVWAGNPAKFLCTLDQYKQRLMRGDSPHFQFSEFGAAVINDTRAGQMRAALEIQKYGFID